MESEWDTLGAVADLVTRLRTAVERDYSGNVLSAYEAEAPTRFQKQLAMLFRGAVVLGMPRAEALTLVCRVGRDCLPRDRVAVLEYVRRRGGLVTATEVADALGRVKMTVRRLSRPSPSSASSGGRGTISKGPGRRPSSATPSATTLTSRPWIPSL